MKSCNPCKAGSYGPYEGISRCFDCPQGYDCPTASVQPQIFQSYYRETYQPGDIVKVDYDLINT